MTLIDRLASAEMNPRSAQGFDSAYALELLAWDLFSGLSLLFAAPVFRGGKLEDAVRTGLYVGGTLCIAGILGVESSFGAPERPQRAEALAGPEAR
jgi:hypothetical protein